MLARRVRVPLGVQHLERLDEPAAGLRYLEKEKLRELLLKLQSEGVTIVLTSSNPLINLPGLSLLGTINLTAPSSGPYAGLVVFEDRPALLGVLPGLGLTFTGGPAVNLIGTIYAPHSVVTYALGGGTHTGQCTRLIADSIIFGLTGASFSKCAVTLGPSAAAPASLLE